MYEDDDVKVMRGLSDYTWGFYAILKKHTGHVTSNEKRYLRNMLKQYGGDWQSGRWKLEGTQALGCGHYHEIIVPKE